MITPSSLAIILQGAPFPGATFTVTPGGAALDLTIGDKTITFCEGAWFAAERRTTPAHLSFAATPTAEQVHAEIRRVLAIVRAPANPSPPTSAAIKADCVGPDLPAVDPLYDRATAAQALAKVTAERDQARVEVDNLNREAARVQEENERLQDRLTTMSAERDRLLISEDTLSKIAAAIAIPALEPYDDALSMVKRLVDGYAVVSQRLVGAQKEVAEVSVERDEATARAAKVEDRLRRDDELRSQLAVAVGLDDSASLALILDTVTRDRPGREISRLSGLLDVLARPMSHVPRPSHLIGALMSDPVLKPPAEAQAYIVELEAKIASNVADLVARDMRIAELERDLACKDDAVKTAIGALKRICEVIGAPVPVCPDDAVEQVKTLLCESEGHNARADRAEATLAEMVKALSDHGAPRHYDDPSTPTKRGAQLSLVERLRVTLSIHHWKASAAERRAHEAEESREALLEERRFARDALLDMGSPCRADGFDLDLAARIRALPR